MDKTQVERVLATLKADTDVFKVISSIVNKTDAPNLDTRAKQRVTKQLKELCGHTTTSLKALYRDPIPNLTYLYILEQEYKIANHDDYKFDPIFQEFLMEYDMYVTDDHKQYPFFKILVDDKVLAYRVYRYIGQLPFYIRLTATKKLPTVDHITRNAFDNRLEGMRYCRFQDNNVNKCRLKGASNKYHGMHANFNYITDRGSAIDAKVLIWCILFDSYLSDKSLDFNESALKHITLSEESCKAKENIETFKHHAMLMDAFVDEMLRLPNVGVYDKDSTALDIPMKHIENSGLTLLVDVWNSYPSKKTPLYTLTVKHAHVGALYYDITRYLKNGEFAHLNFIKRKPSQGLVVPDSILSPVDVLNMFEEEQDATYLDDYHKKIGLNVEPGKIKRYVKDGRDIRVVWMDRDPDYKSFLVKAEDGGRLTNRMYYEVENTNSE